jgi:Tudor domain
MVQDIGIVTNFESHSHFFFRVQFPFELLDKRLQSRYSRMPPKEIPIRWKKTAFAASVNDRWYRAEVMSVLMGSKAKVMLVDIGRSVDVPVNNLRLLDKEDAEVPVKTICCALRGVMEENTDQIESIMQGVLGKVVEARFVSKIGDNKYSTILTKGKLYGNPYY